MLWFYVLVVAAVALALMFYGNRRRIRRRAGGRERTLTEASAEIGAPPEAVDRERALLSDRLAGVSRPLVSEPHEGEKRHNQELRRGDGSLRDRPLRKENLSKEVEVDWEASEVIEFQPGAWARPRDFRDEPTEGFLRKTGELGAQRQERDYVLPDAYGKDRLVLMARDPRWIYAYWEVAHDRYQEMREKRLSEWGLSRPVLRLYDLTEPGAASKHLDVQLRDDAENWYIKVDRPQHRFVAELGREFPDGFWPIVRSNEVSLPPESVSMEMAEEWAALDWEANYGRFAGKVGVSSPGVWGK